MQAIFGPSDPLLGPHVQSICDALDIPHLETRLELESRADGNELSINLHPSQDTLNAAYKDLMRFLNWTKVAIVYEDEGGNRRSIFSNMFLFSIIFGFPRANPHWARDGQLVYCFDLCPAVAVLFESIPLRRVGHERKTP